VSSHWPGVAAWSIRCYRRGHFPAIAMPLEFAGWIVIGLA
jgi:hypothetical protein